MNKDPFFDAGSRLSSGAGKLFLVYIRLIISSMYW